MDRRGLLKTAGLCLAAAFLPDVEWGGSMRYGDLLAKLASGQTLSPGEQEALRLAGNNIENSANIAGAWAGSGGGIDVDTVRARQAEFDFQPTNMIRIRSVAGSSMTITSTGYKALTFDEVVHGGPESAFTWSSATADRIYWSGDPFAHQFMLFGTVNWNPNSSGIRALALTSYSDADALITQAIPSALAAAGGGYGFSQPFIAVWRKLKTEAYCKLEAYQDGAGSVAVNFRELTAMRIW